MWVMATRKRAFRFREIYHARLLDKLGLSNADLRNVDLIAYLRPLEVNDPKTARKILCKDGNDIIVLRRAWEKNFGPEKYKRIDEWKAEYTESASTTMEPRPATSNLPVSVSNKLVRRNEEIAAIGTL